MAEADDPWDLEKFALTEAQMAEHARAMKLRANDRLSVPMGVRDDMLFVVDFVLREVLPRIEIAEYPARAKKKGRPAVRDPETLGELEMALEDVRAWLTQTSSSPWWKRKEYLGYLS